MLDIAITGQALVHGSFSLGTESEPARHFLQHSSLAFANLEVAGEAAGAWPTKTKTVHAASAAAIAALKALGLTALGHANNHAFDLGPPGIVAAHAYAGAAGLAIAGSGVNAEAAGKAVVVTTAMGRVAIIAADLGPQPEIVYAGVNRPGINALRVYRSVTVPGETFGVLSGLIDDLGDGALQKSRAAVGYRASMPDSGIEVFGTSVVPGTKTASSFYPDQNDLAALTRQIEQAKLVADVVLVCLHSHHWKADWGDMPDWFMDLGRGLIDSGADLIVGHGVPVLQPIVFHRGKPIFGSLGNVIFHTERAATYDREGVDVWSGALCKCRFADGLCESIDIMPIMVGRPEAGEDGLPPAPRPLTGDAATRVFERLAAGLSDADRSKLRLGGD